MKKALLITLALLFSVATFAQSRGVLINEKFDSTKIPSGWKVMGKGTQNWSIKNTDLAGGEPNELDLFWDPGFDGISRMVMAPVDLTNINALAVSFKHHLDYYPYYDGICLIGLATSSDEGTTWNIGWSQAYDKTDKYVVDEIITTPDMGKANVLICLYFEGNTDIINSWQFDNILIFAQEENDAELLSVDVPENLGNGYNNVSFSVRNLGTSNIETFEAKYQIEGQDTFVSETFSTDIEPFGTRQFTFGQNNLFETGDITLNIEVTSVNGVNDEYTDNNSNSKEITVGMRTAQKIPMIEHFSSSTCFPCVYTNKGMDTLTQNNAGKYTYVKYPMNGPGTGDPYYYSECNTRRVYYGVNDVPTLFLDGNLKLTDAVPQDKLDNSYNEPSFFDIRGSFTMEDGTIKVIADFMSYIDMEGLRTYITVNEKTTTGNIGSNGETEFHHILMKMLGSAQGKTVNFKAGKYQRFEFSFDMTSTNVEELDDLEVAIWIQNPKTKEIYNSRFAYDYTEHVYPARNLSITTVGEDPRVQLTWEAPEANTPMSYYIYVDGKLVAMDVKALTYTDQHSVWNIYDDKTHYIEVVAIYDNGKRSVGTIGKMSDVVNVKEIEDHQRNVNIYPNPAKDEIHVSSEERIEEVRIYNINGQQTTVNSQQTSSTGMTINISNLNSGVYFIKIDTERGNIVKRFIKN